LPVGQAGSINRLIGLVLAVPGVEDVRLLHAELDGSTDELLDPVSGRIEIAGFPTVLGDLQIADPALASLVGTIVIFPESSSPPDVPSIQSALDAALAY